MHLFRIYGNQKWPGIFMFLHFRQNQAARRHILRRLLPVGVRTNFLLGGRGDGSSVIFLLVILVSDFSPLAWLASLLRTNTIRITRKNDWEKWLEVFLTRRLVLEPNFRESVIDSAIIYKEFHLLTRSSPTKKEDSVNSWALFMCLLYALSKNNFQPRILPSSTYPFAVWTSPRRSRNPGW